MPYIEVDGRMVHINTGGKHLSPEERQKAKQDVREFMKRLEIDEAAGIDSVPKHTEEPNPHEGVAVLGKDYVRPVRQKYLSELKTMFGLDYEPSMAEASLTTGRVWMMRLIENPSGAYRTESEARYVRTDADRARLREFVDMLPGERRARRD